MHRITRRHALVLPALALLPGLGAAPWPAAADPVTRAPPRPSAHDLAGDADILERAFEALHPGLYRYNTAAQIGAHFDLLRSELRLAADAPRWTQACFLALSRLAAKIRCGHTYANFSNQSHRVQEEVVSGSGRLPLEFCWLDGRMIVTRDLSQEQCLPVGTEVVAIQGEPVSTVLDRLMAYARADGANDARRVALLEVQGLDRYETFDVFFGLLWPLGDRVDLDIRRPREPPVRRVRASTLTPAQRLSARHIPPSDARSGWRLDRTDDGLAILRMPTWALYHTQWDWQKFLQETFEGLDRHRARALVIDLRGNEGGLEVGNEILPFLAAREILLPQPPRLVRYRDVPAELDPVLDTWDDSFRHWGEAATRVDDRYFALGSPSGSAAGLRISPRTPRFTGPVFVLIGPDNSSATFQFAQDVRSSQLGRLVGRTTGGNLRGINGGAFFFVRLPASGIEVDLPLIARFSAGQPPDAGLAPDVPTVRTIADIQGGVDVELQAVRGLLQP